MSVTFDQEELRCITVFENKTDVSVRDCVVADNYAYFVVNPADMAQAIGKGGRNVKELQNQLNKTIRVVEYDEDIPTFVENITDVSADNVTVNKQDGQPSVTIHDTGQGRDIPKEVLKRLLRLEHQVETINFTRNTR